MTGLNVELSVEDSNGTNDRGILHRLVSWSPLFVVSFVMSLWEEILGTVKVIVVTLDTRLLVTVPKFVPVVLHQ